LYFSFGNTKTTDWIKKYTSGKRTIKMDGHRGGRAAVLWIVAGTLCLAGALELVMDVGDAAEYVNQDDLSRVTCFSAHMDQQGFQDHFGLTNGCWLMSNVTMLTFYSNGRMKTNHGADNAPERFVADTLEVFNENTRAFETSTVFYHPAKGVLGISMAQQYPIVPLVEGQPAWCHYAWFPGVREKCYGLNQRNPETNTIFTEYIRPSTLETVATKEISTINGVISSRRIVLKQFYPKDETTQGGYPGALKSIVFYTTSGSVPTESCKHVTELRNARESEKAHTNARGEAEV
jgi:hypothetical protein